MAKLAHYSVATLAEAARGLHKPSLKVTLAYVAACGGDLASWSRRWHSVSSELEARDAPGPGRLGGPEREPPRSGRRGAGPGGPERGADGDAGWGAAPAAGRARDQARDMDNRVPVRGPARNREPDDVAALQREPDNGPARNREPDNGPARDREPDRGPDRMPGHGWGHPGTLPPTASANGPATDELTLDERAELRRLRSEVEELRRANEVLKAASAIFAADLRTTSKVVYNSAGRQDRLA
ncbi:hypothetical protein [Streptomyces sp. CB03234]|uniref:hypothetical protein n=1 Tax=Streptomyces sp. (strain CB03234) TaxID=1703937 RepID=UPI00093B4DEF|nr:hypothetical protein [Streptomyces sp. CB03234]